MSHSTKWWRWRTSLVTSAKCCSLLRATTARRQRQQQQQQQQRVVAVQVDQHERQRQQQRGEGPALMPPFDQCHTTGNWRLGSGTGDSHATLSALLQNLHNFKVYIVYNNNKNAHRKCAARTKLTPCDIKRRTFHHANCLFDPLLWWCGLRSYHLTSWCCCCCHGSSHHILYSKPQTTNHQ